MFYLMMAVLAHRLIAALSASDIWIQAAYDANTLLVQARRRKKYTGR